MDVGIVVLRVVLGLAIAVHGAQKLFGWFDGPGFNGFAGWLKSMGFRPARAQAALSGTAEFGGGIALALGFLTPLGAAAIIGTMIAAIATVHWTSGFFNAKGGYEFPLVVAAAASAVAFTGPGAYSVDSALGWNLAGSGWGAAAAILGGLTAFSVVASRRKPEPVAVPDLQEPAEPIAA